MPMEQIQPFLKMWISYKKKWWFPASHAGFLEGVKKKGVAPDSAPGTILGFKSHKLHQAVSF